MSNNGKNFYEFGNFRLDPDLRQASTYTRTHRLSGGVERRHDGGVLCIVACLGLRHLFTDTTPKDCGLTRSTRSRNGKSLVSISY